jgi:two-component system NtrC family sensor kinase
MTSAPASVLVVEDSDTQALALRQLLEQQGYAVQRAASAEAALEMLNGPLPDLIVADFHLPGMDGRELSRQIRLNGRTRTLPLLMLTSAREVDLERQGLESGVDAYVSKSADKDVVLVRLQALLRRGQGAGALTEKGAAFRRARVLIVHDSATARLRLRQILEEDGYEAAAGEDVDCVVLPFEGATLDGLRLCDALAARREGMSAPYQIVVLGPGPDRPGELAAAFAAGADEVGGRDDGEDVLRARVRALMRRKLLADENRRVLAAEARAAAADELSRANIELEAANRQLKEAQAQLVQAAKMASLGELVAGIAHEINNPLAFILAHHATVERLIAEDAPEPAALGKARDRLKSMRLGLQRIQSLVLNLRKFSRLDEAEMQVLDVPDAIETVLALLAPKLGEIEVQRELAARTGLFGSPALLNQVVMNIVANAADALEGRGVIRISSAEADGRYAIVIEDSGPGIPAELRDRIFEPFFTTKPVGSGTGLGLAIAYSVVRAHAGEITVDDSALGGARFTLSLPLGEAA